MGMTFELAGIVKPKEIAPGILRIEHFFPDAFMALQTTREGGVSQGVYASFNLATHVGDDPAAVAANRQRLAQLLPNEPRWLEQVHGSDVASCDQAFASGLPKADSGIASAIGVVPVVMTADCLPLLVARPATGQCAAIHAGWKGLSKGVIEATLDQMLAQGRTPDASIEDVWLIWLGPSIGPTAFEVGNDVRDVFISDDPDSAIAFTSLGIDLPQKWRAHLAKLAILRLARWARTYRGATSPEALSGKASDARLARLVVAQSGDCVYRDAEQYFSFRREKVTGRMASLICRLN